MFKFKIEYYNEIKDKNLITEGFVSGKTYKEVSSKLSEYYGEDNILSMALDYVTDIDILEIPNAKNIADIFEENRV